MRATFDAGLAAYAAGNFAAAVECFNRVVDERHDDADAHNNLGLSYLALGEYEDAADAFTLAVHFRPQFPPAFYNMALAALGLGELGQAVTSLERALALQPDFATAHSTLGYVLSHQVGEFEAGATHVRKAMELDPADPDVRCNFSAILIQEGRAEEALAICRELLAAHPAMHEAQLNQALANLKLGRFEAGWPDYEARKRARGNYLPRTLPLAEWQGEPLACGKLLIYAEQGVGDQIMFASCVPRDVRDRMCAQAGAAVSAFGPGRNDSVAAGRGRKSRAAGASGWHRSPGCHRQPARPISQAAGRFSGACRLSACRCCAG